MKKIEKLYNYIANDIICDPTDFTLLSASFIALILWGTILGMQFAYLWIIIIVSAIVTLGCHGYNRNRNIPVSTTETAYIQLVAMIIAIIVNAITPIPTESEYCGLCTVMLLISTISSAAAITSILKMLNDQDSSWLSGTHGRIGAANWISLSRLGISLAIPAIYWYQPFSDNSNTIAVIALAYAMITDAVDGRIARELKQTTKAGKALDPLCDKVIFYPVAVAFALITNGNMLINDIDEIAITWFCLIIMLCRDALYIYWFCRYYKFLKEGIGASLTDKVRMCAMCVWLGAIALGLSANSYEFSHIMSAISYVAIIAIAGLSIASIWVDSKRLHDIIDTEKNGDGEGAN